MRALRRVFVKRLQRLRGLRIFSQRRRAITQTIRVIRLPVTIHATTRQAIHQTIHRRTMTRNSARTSRMRPLAALYKACGVMLLAAVETAATLCAQAVPAQHKILLQAELKPGMVLRYELEAAASFVPVADASGAILTPPRGPCDYALSAIVTLRPQAADKDGNTPVEARYSETRVTSVRCALFSPADFQKRLAALQASPVMF